MQQFFYFICTLIWVNPSSILFKSVNLYLCLIMNFILQFEWSNRNINWIYAKKSERWSIDRFISCVCMCIRCVCMCNNILNRYWSIYCFISFSLYSYVHMSGVCTYNVCYFWLNKSVCSYTQCDCPHTLNGNGICMCMFRKKLNITVHSTDRN